MTYLNKEKLTEELNKTPMIAQHIDCMDLFDAITNSVAENVAEVVRCKDCKYGMPSSDGLMLCNKGVYFDRYKKSDWFCADGEHK